MAMVMITGRLPVDPAQRDAFLAFARELVPHERTQPGCLAFDIFEDVTAPNQFLMLEQWESEEALDDHTSTDAFDANEARLNSFLIGEPAWDEYQF
ncbi:MAG: putative quinol monooxygenase [bacterium]|nr:putative quinol monooxygenase [bacterium]